MLKKITFSLLILGLTLTVLSFCKNEPLEDNKNPKQASTKYIYLTFDDGPLNGSQRINNVILSEKVPVTVLLVGKHALARPQYVNLYRKNEFIEIGNHSYSHANARYRLYYSNPEGVLKDFTRNIDTLRLTDKKGRLPGRNMWRINGRSRNDINSGIKAADLLSENGFSLFGWDLEWMHDPHTAEPIGTAEEIFKQIEEHLDSNKVFTKSHLVLLCHDEMFQRPNEESELRRLIALLKSREDYKFAQLKDYP